MNYLNAQLSISERVKDLLSRMTVDEKIDQMLVSYYDAKALKKDIEDGKKPSVPGTIGMFGGSKSGTETLRVIRKYCKENMRIYIPVLSYSEALHGVRQADCTVFPQSMAMGATFNVPLMEKIADIIGKESRAVGVTQVLAPVLDLAREPRWGRAEECYGEDPHLAAGMGVAYVKGVQKNGVAATLKHFIGYGSPEGGLNLAPSHLGEREVREVMLEPFRAAIKEGGALGVMASYNEIDGIPIHASKRYLGAILRDELGFDGLTIADGGGISLLYSVHKTAPDRLSAGAQAVSAGVDIELAAVDCYNDDFRKAVKEGKIDVKLIDRAAARVLTVKFKLGLFDGYEMPNEGAVSALRSQGALELSKHAAKESIVLLKNDGVLPIRADIGKIALIGPNADEAQLGDYTDYGAYQNKARCITPKDGLEKRFGKDKIIYAKGCETAAADETLLSEAAEAAQNADVAVLVLGDCSHYSWGWTEDNHTITSGEGFDLAELKLPKAQRLLLKRVKQTGVPIVLVLNTGKTYCIGKECDASSAVLQAWYLGERGGEALAGILAGDDCPSGRLPVSFPRTTGHLPCYYNYKPSARGVYKKHGSLEKPGRDYVFDSPDALFEFGYGLSYTSFEYSRLSAEVTPGYNISVSVNVKNTGDYDAYESVLLFTNPEYCPVTPFVKRLRGFKKIFIKKGEDVNVAFNLTADDFTYIDEDMKTQICEGRHFVRIDKLSCSVDISAGHSGYSHSPIAKDGANVEELTKP